MESQDEQQKQSGDAAMAISIAAPSQPFPVSDVHMAVNEAHGGRTTTDTDTDTTPMRISSTNNATCGTSGVIAYSSQSWPPAALSDPATATAKNAKDAKEPRLGFPVKVYDMLEDADSKNFSHIVSWNPSGDGFMVHDKDQFTREIVPRYFALTKYKSFQRQLSLYGFQRVTVGPNKGLRFIEKLRRGRPDLVNTLKPMAYKPRNPERLKALKQKKQEEQKEELQQRLQQQEHQRQQEQQLQQHQHQHQQQEHQRRHIQQLQDLQEQRQQQEQQQEHQRRHIQQFQDLQEQHQHQQQQQKQKQKLQQQQEVQRAGANITTTTTTTVVQTTTTSTMLPNNAANNGKGNGNGNGNTSTAIPSTAVSNSVADSFEPRDAYMTTDLPIDDIFSLTPNSNMLPVVSSNSIAKHEDQEAASITTGGKQLGRVLEWQNNNVQRVSPETTYRNQVQLPKTVMESSSESGVCAQMPPPISRQLAGSFSQQVPSGGPTSQIQFEGESFFLMPPTRELGINVKLKLLKEFNPQSTLLQMASKYVTPGYTTEPIVTSTPAPAKIPHVPTVEAIHPDRPSLVEPFTDLVGATGSAASTASAIAALHTAAAAAAAQNNEPASAAATAAAAAATNAPSLLTGQSRSVVALESRIVDPFDLQIMNTNSGLTPI